MGEPEIAFWGLGNMGGPMAMRLLRAGLVVHGADPSAAARARFEAAGGRPIDGARIPDVGVVVLMLPSSDIVEHVLLREGVADALAAGSVVIDMSSSSPTRTAALATALAERGLTLVDAPVSGGVAGAEAGTLSIMVGGDASIVDRVRPLLSQFGKPVHVGQAGAGHALKALNNLMSAVHLWVSSEAILVGERFGLDPAVMLETVNTSSGRSGSTQNKWPNFILPGGFDSGFGLQLMLKDMRIATDLAHELGLPMTLGDMAVEHWAKAAEELPVSADHTEIVRYLRAVADAGRG